MKKFLIQCIGSFLLVAAGISSVHAQFQQQVYSTTNIKDLGSMAINDTMMLLHTMPGVPQTSTAWQGRYSFSNESGSVILRMREDLLGQTVPDNFTCNVTVSVTCWKTNDVGASLPASQSISLAVTYDKRTGFAYDEAALKTFSEAQYLGVRLDYISNPSVKTLLQLQLKLDGERRVKKDEYDLTLAPCMLKTEYMAGSNEWKITFDESDNPKKELLEQADEFDVEWVFIDYYDEETYQTSDPMGMRNYTFKNNATRVVLGKNQRTFAIKNVFEKGFVIFRYRTVGYYQGVDGNGDPVIQRLTGKWSIEDDEFDPEDIETSGCHGVKNSFGMIHESEPATPHFPEMNWQYISVFAEEGKTKETIGYYDGSMRGRQTVATNNADQVVMVQENIFDYNGRPAIQVLPVPVEGLLTFYPNLNKANSTTPYSAADFDLDNTTCSSEPGAMDDEAENSAAEYYSANNPFKNGTLTTWDVNKFIPVAGGFPFTQTVFMNDNTGRVAAQSGVGADHVIGSGHETRYAYETPFQEELTRLFGTDVGYAAHYKKNTVIDANGQPSVSYLDLKGHVIATALAADPTGNNFMEQLDNNEVREDIEVSLVNQAEVQVSENAFVYTKRIHVLETGDYRFKYSILPQDYAPADHCPETTPCYDCVYDLEIRLVDECGTNVLDGDHTTAGYVLLHRLIGGDAQASNYSPACTTNTEYSFESDSKLNTTDQFISVSLEPGTYTIHRTLTINEQGYKNAEKHYLQNSICKTYEDFLTEAEAALDLSGCFVTCESCKEQFEGKSLGDFITAIETDLDRSLTPEEYLEWSTFYGETKQKCDELSCAERNQCSVIKDILLADVSPGGQYAAYDYELVDGVPVFTVRDQEINFLSSTWISSLPVDAKVNINGLVVNANLLSAEEIVKYWNPQWAENWLNSHPEACEYWNCTALEASYNKVDEILQVKTYDEAVAGSYISGTVLNLSGSAPFSASGHVQYKMGSYTELNFDPVTPASATKSDDADPHFVSAEQLILFGMFYEHLKDVSLSYTEFLDKISEARTVKFDECNGAYKDLYWTQLMGIYLSEDRSYQKTLTGPCPLGALPEGMERRFYQEATQWPGNGGNAPDATYVNGSLEDHCATQCESYREVWKGNLASCNLPSDEMENLLDQLETVCINGCDEYSPMGASSVAPAKTGEVLYLSFEDVLHQFTYGDPATRIFDTKLCTDLLITMPAPYGHDYFAKSSPFADTCVCDEGTPPTNCPCSTSTAYTGTNNTAVKLLRPDVADEDKCEHCVECSQTANAFYDFTTVYPMQFSESVVYEKAETGELLVKFFNKRLGLNLSYEDYVSHLSACLGYQDVPADRDIFEEYAQTYLMSRTKTMKETGLVASNITIPAGNAFKYQVEHRPVDGYRVDYTVIQPVYASVESTAGYAPQIQLIPLSSLYFQLDCLCPKVLENNGAILDVNAPVILREDGSNPNQAFYDSIFSICKERQDLLDKCREDNVRIAARLGINLDDINPSQWSEDIVNSGLKFCTNEVGLLMLQKFLTISINLTISGSLGEELDCPSIVEGGGAGSNPGDGGGIGGEPTVFDCHGLMPVFQDYYDTELISAFESGDNLAMDLKDYLANVLPLSEFEDMVAHLNGYGANIDDNASRAEQMDRLWSILRLCRERSCEQFLSMADYYDNHNQEELINNLGKGLHDLAAEGSTESVYLTFKEGLNIAMNKPPFLTFFDDETVSKHFTSCAVGPCEVITEVLEEMKMEYSTAFSEPLSTTQILRKEENGDLIEDFLASVNIELARSPYFKTLDRNRLIAAVEMCENCLGSGLPLEDPQHVVNDLLGENVPVVAGPSTPPTLLNILPLFLKSGWLVNEKAPNIAEHYFAKNRYRSSVTYRVGEVALDNSFMYGEARPPAGNYFYVKMATVLEGPPSNPSSYIPSTPDGDFAFANVIDIDVLHVVRLSAFEIQVIAEAEYNSIFNPGTTASQALLITIPSYAYYENYLSGQECKHNHSVCNKPVNEYTVTVAEDPCVTRLKMIAKGNAYNSYTAYVAGLKEKFRQGYVSTCMNRSALNEDFQMKYDQRQYQYTLYYYDQAGNLVKTVPPAGVEPLSAIDVQTADTKRATNLAFSTSAQHAKTTRYQYNSLNQLVWQQTPDAGVSRFWYDRVGRIVLSKNAKQDAQLTKEFSYTFYDGLGRITETGQLSGLTDVSPTLAEIRDLTDFNTWILTPGAAGTSITRSQITRTFYDAFFSGYTASSSLIGTEFANLRGRVVHSAYYEMGSDATPQSAVHYSYDIHGNVKTLYRELADLSPLEQDIKRVDYEYDLVSGKVNRVLFQEGKSDQYIHVYRYDAENRLTTALTGSSPEVLEEDANYYYYLHGPMARMEYGAHDVQGLDYTYTIQGWLKSVNSATLDHTRDPGRDGYSSCVANRYNARDVFGFELSYYRGDYTPAATFSTTEFSLAEVPVGAAIHNAAPDLYNGNIRYMVTSNNKFNTLLSAYTYDQLNRLKDAVYFDNLDRQNNTWGTGAAGTAHHNTFTYDADGNILTQLRKGGADNPDMDDLAYVYEAGTNKLVRVEDAVAAEAYSDDINPQSGTNYTYDPVGNLVGDVAEEIAEIKWNVYGKITSIIREPGSLKPDLIFSYTPDGHRVSKTVIPKNGTYPRTTYYVRDAQGNILATYSRKTDKIIDYESLSYADVNDELSALIGDEGFGAFIANLHTTHINNSGFDYNLLDAFNADPFIETRLMEMPVLTVLNSATVYVNWLQSRLDQVTMLQNVFEDNSGVIPQDLCDCSSGGPNPLMEVVLMNRDITLAFFNALCMTDLANSTGYTVAILSNVYGFGNCPLGPTEYTNIYNDLDPLNANLSTWHSLYYSAIQSVLNCYTFQQALVTMAANSPTEYYNLLAAVPNNTMLAQWDNFMNCGGSFELPSALAIYKYELLLAIYRFDPFVFSNLVTNAGFSYSTPTMAISDLSGIPDEDLFYYLNSMGMYPGGGLLEPVMRYLYMQNRAAFNSIMRDMAYASYSHTCATSDAYPCLPSYSYNNNETMVNVFGNPTLWAELYNINTPQNYANMVYSNDPHAFMEVAAKYHKSDISSYQEANRAGLYGSNGMHTYFDYIRTLVGNSTYNALFDHYMETSATYSDTLKLDEWQLYGSSRLGIQKAERVIAAVTYTADYLSGSFSNISYNLAWQYEPSTTEYTLSRGNKRYELSNHLGNVLSVVSDKKLPHEKNAVYLEETYTSTNGTMLPISFATIGVSGGELQVTTTGTSQIGGIMPQPAPAGRQYKVNFSLTLGSGVTSVAFELISSYAAGNTRQHIYYATATGAHTYTITAPQGLYRFKFHSNGPGSYTIDNLNIREYQVDSQYYQAEVIEAGDYSPFGAPMAGRRYQAPVEPQVQLISNDVFTSSTSGWTAEGSGVTLSVQLNHLIAQTSGGVNKGMKKTFTTEAGKRYRIRLALHPASWPMLYVTDQATGTELLRSNGLMMPDAYTYTFVATGTQTDVKLLEVVNTSGTVFLRYFTLEEVVEKTGYRFGFNGKEVDDETYGDGNAYDFGARVYDARLGRFLSVDNYSATYASISPYAFCANTPTIFIDADGNKFINPYTRRKEKAELQVQTAKDAYNDFMKTHPDLSKNPSFFRKLFNADYREKGQLQDDLDRAENAYSEAAEKEVLVNNMLYTYSKIDPERYNRFDNLKNPDGTDVAIVLYLDDNVMFRDGGTSGETPIPLVYNAETNQKAYGTINITLYFNQDVGTFGNEIGDIEFTQDKINTQEDYDNWKNPDIPYGERKESIYSFEVERDTRSKYNTYKKENNIKSTDTDKRGSLKK